MSIPNEIFGQWVASLEERVRAATLGGRSVDQSVEFVAAAEKSDWGWNPDALVGRLKALDAAAAAFREKLESVSYLQKSSIRFGREAWYAGPGEDADNWQGLEASLRRLRRTNEEIRLVDEESNAIVSLLDNPSARAFSTRGLVVGHVQSGKTGSMAAVVAKASDTPFKFFIVLSGMTDTLRNQTQVRFDRDVIGTAPDRWYSWTSADQQGPSGLVSGDFRHPASGGFIFDHRNQLAVIKKNPGVLRKFLAKLRSSSAALLADTPFLIIDDECDQASVNSARYQTAVSTINGLIRDILAVLPRAAYVGYTATPFANVLIDPSVPGDLYPRDFIYALRKPDAYFGAERLFGRSSIDGEYVETDEGLDMIRIVPEDDIPKMRAKSRKAAVTFEMTPSLAKAISYFVMVTAARQARGQGDDHSTMLVHTSVLNTVHKQTESVIKPFIEDLRSRLGCNDASTLRDLQGIWEDEGERLPSQQFDGLEPVPFASISALLFDVAKSIEVKVENWSSDNRIDYQTPARRYLVIGGNVLARGLTLEGLAVSYFLRSSSQYDTLMQMGRWFGYRHGFEDLPRIWMEDSVMQNFYDLATVEHEMRQDIAIYARTDTRPDTFAVRIRQIPGMAITAKAKRRSAIEVKIGYAGSHQQTTRFKRNDGAWLEENWTAADDLLSRAGDALNVRGNRVYSNVPVSEIAKFLERYSVHPSHENLARELLLRYIVDQAKSSTSFRSWNVVVISAAGGIDSVETLGGEYVPTVVRSALTGSGADACVKALMSKGDVFADMATLPAGAASLGWDAAKSSRNAASMPPLLLMYPINRTSKPAAVKPKKSQPREPLGAVRDVLGLGLVFPGTPSSAQVYVAADLRLDDAAEEIGGEDDFPQDVVEVTSEVGS